MIIDTLSHSTKYLNLSPMIAEAMHFLRTNDLSGLEDGKIELEGDAEGYAVVMSYETQPPELKKWEAHRKYIDIQYMISGTEWMGYAPYERMTVKQPYNSEKDVEFLDGEGCLVRVDQGMFALFAPQDAHQPGVCVGQPQAVRKIVFKVTANSWKDSP